jgi:hypothetical protein
MFDFKVRSLSVEEEMSPFLLSSFNFEYDLMLIIGLIKIDISGFELRF